MIHVLLKVNKINDQFTTCRTKEARVGSPIQEQVSNTEANETLNVSLNETLNANCDAPSASATETY